MGTQAEGEREEEKVRQRSREIMRRNCCHCTHSSFRLLQHNIPERQRARERQREREGEGDDGKGCE